MRKILNNLAQRIFNGYKNNERHLHELRYLFWECTQRCNLNCRHCGSDCRRGDEVPETNTLPKQQPQVVDCIHDSKVPDMPFEDFLRAILPLKEVYDPNKITIAITGGEPLMRPDLAQCGRALREHGFRWGMVTNGFGYTPQVHKELLAAGMGSITLSLDGLKDTHNWMRGDDQSFDRAVAALSLITTTPRLMYDVVTCVNKKNINELEQIKEFLITQQVSVWRLFTIAPIGRAAHNDDMILDPQQLKYLMEFIVCEGYASTPRQIPYPNSRRLIAGSRADKRMKVTFSCEAYLGEYERRARDAFFFCRAGIQIASVLIDGSISACPNINRNFVQGNIYRDSLLDVWNNRFQLMRDRRWTKTGICRNCKDYPNCQGGAMHLWDEKQDSIMTCIHNQLQNKTL